MLTITENAAMAIGSVTRAKELPASSGIRIASGEPDNGDGSTLRLTVEHEPDDGDQVVERAGARVFLDPDIADELDDKVLDAGTDEDGRINFVVGRAA